MVFILNFQKIIIYTVTSFAWKSRRMRLSLGKIGRKYWQVTDWWDPTNIFCPYSEVTAESCSGKLLFEDYKQQQKIA